MRFEPKDFLTKQKKDNFLTGVQISPHPCCISLVLISFITLADLWLQVNLLPFPLRIAVYILYALRVVLLIWFFCSSFSYLTGKVQITTQTILAVNIPPKQMKSITINLSDIDKISVHYGIFGKSFGYGAIILHLQNQKTTLSYIKNPDRVKEYLEKLRKTI